MTYWVTDLQRRIYATVRGGDALLEEERVSKACGPARRLCYGPAGRAPCLPGVAACVSTPACHTACPSAEGRGSTC